MHESKEQIILDLVEGYFKVTNGTTFTNVDVLSIIKDAEGTYNYLKSNENKENSSDLTSAQRNVERFSKRLAVIKSKNPAAESSFATVVANYFDKICTYLENSSMEDAEKDNTKKFILDLLVLLFGYCEKPEDFARVLTIIDAYLS